MALLKEPGCLSQVKSIMETQPVSGSWLYSHSYCTCTIAAHTVTSNSYCTIAVINTSLTHTHIMHTYSGRN